MATPRCWIGVAARAHALAGQAGSFAMFAHGKHSAVLRLHPGDWFAYYAPTQSLGGKQAVRRFVALGRIADGAPENAQMGVDAMGWRRAAHYLSAQEADIYPLLDQFAFVSDRSHWGMYFRKSLFSIEPADFSLVADAMGVGAQFNLGDNL